MFPLVSSVLGYPLQNFGTGLQRKTHQIVGVVATNFRSFLQQSSFQSSISDVILLEPLFGYLKGPLRLSLGKCFADTP